MAATIKQKQFIEQIAALIIKYAPQYNIKVVSPIIAQACLESAYGTSELAVNANNFFGLKYNPKQPNRCKTNCGYYVKVGSEQTANGAYVSSTMLWQKFKNMEDSVIGYFDFINIANYSNLKGVTDPRKYLENIKADRYATSLNYVDKVFNVIVQKNLTVYDALLNKSTAGSNNNITGVIHKIAIDAGHGSQTAGKRTPDGYREHYANVKVANYLYEILKKNGFNILKTGWNDNNALDDVDVPLTTRQAQIKQFGAEVSVSIHFNAYGNGKNYNNANGLEVLISNKSAGDSLNFANVVYANLMKGTKQTGRGVKTQALAMCNCSALGTKASILCELAFMTNQYEATLMQNDDFCYECAAEIALGICQYLGVNYKQVNVNTNKIQEATNNAAIQTGNTSVQTWCHIVKKGDTLNKIAAELGTTAQALATVNNIANINLIKPGQMIWKERVIAGTINTNGSALRIRTEPNTTSAIKGLMSNKSTCYVLGISGNFYKVLYGGLEGYAAVNYIKLS